MLSSCATHVQPVQQTASVVRKAASNVAPQTVAPFDHSYLGQCWGSSTDRTIIVCDPWPPEYNVAPYTVCHVTLETGAINCDASTPAAPTNLNILSTEKKK